MRATRFLYGAAALAILSCASVAHAQLDFSQIPGAANSVVIALSPTNPVPGDQVTATAESPLLDLSNADIEWRVNGKSVGHDQGLVSIQVTAGDYGQKTTLGARIMAADGTAASASTAFIPSAVDLLVTSDAYTPPFFSGRALPSAGTSLRAEARAHFLKGGSEVPPASIIYTWKQNGRVLGTASGKGRYTAVIPSPGLYESNTIEVDATSVDGIFSGAATFSIASQDPRVVLYEDHPLYGILYYKALASDTSIPEREMTFAAVPYYAQATSPNDARLTYDWSVNNAPIAVDPANPSELTINASNSTGAAAIALHLTHTTNFYLDAHGAWAVTLAGGSGASSGGDAFHGGI